MYSERELGVYLAGGRAIAGPSVITVVSFKDNPCVDFNFARFILYKRRFVWNMAPSFMDALAEQEPQLMSQVISVHEINTLGEEQAYARALEHLLAKYCFRYKITPSAVKLYQPQLEGSLHYKCVRASSPLEYMAVGDYLGFTAFVISEARRRRLLTRLNRIFSRWRLDEHWGKGPAAREEVWMLGPDPYLHRMEVVSRLPEYWYGCLRKASQGKGGIYSYQLYDWHKHKPKWWHRHFEAEFLSGLDGWERRKLVEHINTIAGTKSVSRKPPKRWTLGVRYSRSLVQDFIASGGRPKYNALEVMRRCQRKLYRKRSEREKQLSNSEKE